MKTATHIALLAGLALAGTAVYAQANLGQGAGQNARTQQGEPMAEFVLNWDMNGDGRVSQDDVATRRADLFAMFDLDGDGGIDGDEQANMAQTIAGQEANNHGGQQGQGGGQGAGQGRGQGQGQGLGHGQGQGQRGQGYGQGQRGQGPRGPGQAIHGAMTAQYNDADGDGIISVAEWEAATPRLFAALDANGDAVIDAADFGR